MDSILGLGPKKDPIWGPGPKKDPGGNPGGSPCVSPMGPLWVAQLSQGAVEDQVQLIEVVRCPARKREWSPHFHSFEQLRCTSAKITHLANR